LTNFTQSQLTLTIVQKNLSTGLVPLGNKLPEIMIEQNFNNIISSNNKQVIIKKNNLKRKLIEQQRSQTTYQTP